jgi:pyruvate dehydrogenase E1 component alpha subunit
MAELTLQNAVVYKPWGYEYLVFQNASVAVWFLHLNYGEATSLHCHPKKKTGLILLSGEAVISFLNDSSSLRPLGRMVIRPGLFHSTRAVSPEGINLLEIETPVEKENLVRFEDAYGREGKAYEGADKMAPIPENFVRFRTPEEGKIHSYEMQGTRLYVEKITDLSVLQSRPATEAIAVLDGGLMSDKGEFIVAPGDVGSLGSLARVAKAFKSPQGITLLTLQTDEKRSDKSAKRGPRLGHIPGLADKYPVEKSLALFRQICINRYFELETAEVYKTGAIKMPIYLSVGQEHIPAAIASVTKNFLIFAQHRGHSYYLSFGGDMRKLIDELLHRPTGCARGMGGSASIHDPSIGMFGHSGLMGDQIPIAVGAALGSGRNTLAVAGDASAEEDYAFGAMGYAATKKLPVLFICEDNNLSILTPVETRRSWSLVDVAKSLGMAAVDIGDDPWLIAHYADAYLANLPAFINIRTCRQLWHAGTGSDGPPEWNRFELIKAELKRLGLDAETGKIEEETRASVKKIWQEQLRKP